MRILITSAGRRVYLVRWFQEALRKLGVEGQVACTEYSETAAALGAADRVFLVPSYSDPKYKDSMKQIIRDYAPDLVLSVNDYELELFSAGLANELRELGPAVISLTSAAQQICSDKLHMYTVLNAGGIQVPRTVALTSSEEVDDLLSSSAGVLVKDRFGSGSSGLALFPRGQDLRKVDFVDPSRFVVQAMIDGQEYGVDIVRPISLAAKGHTRVLARRKLAMRSGETDTAISVDPTPFVEISTRLGELLGSQGLVDTDVLVGSCGTQYLIDINPRFGGGYPFMHAAGTDIPAAYLGELLGREVDPSWYAYDFGQIIGKYVDVIPVKSEGTS